MFILHDVQISSCVSHTNLEMRHNYGTFWFLSNCFGVRVRLTSVCYILKCNCTLIIFWLVKHNIYDTAGNLYLVSCQESTPGVLIE